MAERFIPDEALSKARYTALNALSVYTDLVVAMGKQPGSIIGEHLKELGFELSTNSNGNTELPALDTPELNQVYRYHTRYGPLIYHAANRQVDSPLLDREERGTFLSPSEGAVLEHLIQHPKMAFSVESIGQAIVWYTKKGADRVSDYASLDGVKQYISYVRFQIGDVNIGRRGSDQVLNLD